MKFEEQQSFTFDDVLIKPQFSFVKSRKDVTLETDVGGLELHLPIFSANMDTISGTEMCKAMNKAGGMGVLHRFWSVEDNVKAYLETKAAVSVGLGGAELERAKALIDAGAKFFFIDVAHGASSEVVNQLHKIKAIKDVWVCVGNFASKESVATFLRVCGPKYTPNAIKVGVGPGSACTTRIKTGVGVPQLSAIIECVEAAYPYPVIADGGLRTAGDIAKAIGAGASAVMIGGMLAGTDETPGEIRHESGLPQGCSSDFNDKLVKRYRGSASKESYEVQGKDTAWRTAEGESFTVLYKGPVAAVLQDIEGGLRSSFTYVGATTLINFKEKVTFIKISANSVKENGAHGKL